VGGAEDGDTGNGSVFSGVNIEACRERIILFSKYKGVSTLVSVNTNKYQH